MSLINRPSQFKSNVILKHRFRWATDTNNGVVNQAFNRFLATSLLFMNIASGTLNYSIIAASKINRVEIYGPCVNSTTLATVSIEWLSNFGPSSEFSDSTTSSASPPHIVCVPPPLSLASFWSLTGSNASEVLFLYTLLPGSIIDIWFDIVLFDGETSSLITTTSSGTVGQLYAVALDGTGASTKVHPVSYATLA
jgi:hypothetical protein